MQINYAGDVDVYRFTLGSATTVHVYATGGLDTVGVLMDASGTEIDANDDETSASNDFGITHALQPGTYYVGVGHWDPAGTGTYSLHLLTSSSTTTTPPSTVNYTDLWWSRARRTRNRAGGLTSITRATSSSGRCSRTTRAAIRCGW